MQKRYAVIVAAGSGSRLGEELPKQFLPLGPQPMLLYSMQKFFDCKAEITLVLPEAHIGTWEKMLKDKNISLPHSIVKGGKERFHSVKNALDNIDDNQGIVAVHDAARPFVSSRLIESIFSESDIWGGAIPLLPQKESIRKQSGLNTYTAEDRSLYFTVQTPQAFHLNALKKAYRQPYNSLFTDDASVFESAGYNVGFVEGDDLNFKVTTAQDYSYAQYLIENKHIRIK